MSIVGSFRVYLIYLPLKFIINLTAAALSTQETNQQHVQNVCAQNRLLFRSPQGSSFIVYSKSYALKSALTILQMMNLQNIKHVRINIRYFRVNDETTYSVFLCITVTWTISPDWRIISWASSNVALTKDLPFHSVMWSPVSRKRGTV